jgi:hypothetical protein
MRRTLALVRRMDGFVSENKLTFSGHETGESISNFVAAILKANSKAE